MLNLRGPVRLALALVILVLLGGLVYNGLVSPATRAVMGMMTARLVPIYSVDTPEKKVALSFDATWGVENTDRLLDLLDRHGLRTTFFLAGYWVEDYPEYVQKIAARGHEIGNHSYAHPHMNAFTREQIIADISRNHNLLKELTGEDSTVFRPPFGEYSDKVIEAVGELGYYTIQWSIDSLDWKDVSADFMVDRVLSRVGSGDIVLFHNAGKHTPAAVSRLIPELQQRGYSIVPVGDLIYRDNYYIEPHSGVQKRKTPPRSQPPATEPASGGPVATDGATTHSAPGISPVAGSQSAPVPALDRRSPVFQVPVQEPLMSLGINIDWGQEYLPSMLETLEARGVKATFFVTGRWARLFPGWVQTLVEAGHEIGNHGNEHAHVKALTDSALESLILGNEELLAELTGRRTDLFAPPYGEWDARVVGKAADLGYWTVLWTADTIDWQRPAPDVIVRRVVSKAAPGAIALMHPTEPTAKALPQMIEALQEQGFELIPVGELIAKGAP